MSELKVYNSYSRQKEVFTPITPGHVGMYVCGPTVSGESHLGHARPYVTFDVIYRYLKHLGYKVRYVRNITDAGHFEEEGREAEDKISKKAVLEKLEPMELVHKYTKLFHWAMEMFNTLPPTIEPTATGHIVEQIEMIKKIMDAGYAYEKNGSVYFNVRKYASTYDYGKLSGRKVDELLETTRDLEGQEEKNDRADFALWKNAAPEHIMRWQSPWGVGFPGWHIECSAMATKYLGPEFDIHGGGMDLQFPHHESEIAQSTICNHVAPVRYWIHNNMITINGRKMGKSYNNVIKLTELFKGNHELLEKPYDPVVVKFFILQSHYGSPLDFSNEALAGSEVGFLRLWKSYENLHRLADSYDKFLAEASNADLDFQTKKLLLEFDEFMNDDFNTAKVIANMFEITSTINALREGTLPISSISLSTFELLFNTMEKYVEEIFGLKGRDFLRGRISTNNIANMLPIVSGSTGTSGYSTLFPSGGTSGTSGYSGYTGPSQGLSGTNGISGVNKNVVNYDRINGMMRVLINLRKDARDRKDFATADRIRDELSRVGIILKDEKDGNVSWVIEF